jgi:hypothetical protein
MMNALKLPMSGCHFRSDNSIMFVNSYGFYWQSSPSSTKGYNLLFNSAIYVSNEYERGDGFNIRCFKN